MNKLLALALAILPFFLASACRRDSAAKPGTPIQLDGRQKFAGTYDVYDTLSNWKYEMVVTLHPGNGEDSLHILNWGDAFDVYVQHDEENYTNFLNFTGGFGALDHAGHRWALYRDYDSAFHYNQLMHDTLRMSYLKNNIAFYVEDGVPYFSQSYREFAVKRDWE